MTSNTGRRAGARFAPAGDSGRVRQVPAAPRAPQVPVTPPAPAPAVPTAPRSARPDETTAFIIAAGDLPSGARPVPAAARPVSSPPAPKPAARPPRPDETAVFLAAAQAVRLDTAEELFEANQTALEDSTYIDSDPVQVPAPQAPAAAKVTADDDDMTSSDYEGVGRSAGLMTVLTIVSRLTGFVRTWAMAAAIGMSTLSSSYQIANNLPNMLYELVMGGMLVTAFLPVYMSVRNERGRQASNEYVGNLLGILLLVLGGISLLGTVFAPGFIWTQSFLSGGGGEMDMAVLLFRFFAIQILFYGLGSVFSGVLNAHRDYFWSTFAPVLNNVIVIASFLAYGPVCAVNEMAGVVLIAVGTTLGVFVQMACQVPALRRHGIRPRLHVDFRDPALRKTLSLGIPTLLATICMFVSTSVTNAAALYVQPETGPSVIAYARLWYTLPYALIAASLSTALYTELSRDAQAGDEDSVREGISNGVSQMLFFLIPFALYLIVFSYPLNMIYCTGKFDVEGVALVSNFLCYLALSLPLFGMFALMQKSFSALMNMKPYSRYCLYSALGQVVFILGVGVVLDGGMAAIALSTGVYYLILNVFSLAWLRRRLSGLRVRTMLRGAAAGLVLGALGAAAGGGMLWVLEGFFGPLAASMPRALGYIAVSGIVSLVVTFGLAAAFKLPEARMITSIVRRVSRR